jgi:hypothetical protein
VDVMPAFALLRTTLDDRYRPEQVAGRCGANPEVVRALARKVAAKRTNVMFGASASKYYHGDLIERLRKFNLELHADKTRVIEFGRFASEQRQRRGQGKPETFNFLGFTHICDKTRQGRFIVLRQTISKRMRAKLVGLKEAMRRRMHLPISEVGRWLGQVLRGHYRYYGVPRNYAALDRFRDRVRRLWQRVLNRRSQKGWTGEARMTRIAGYWLPRPRICQPYPDVRLSVIIQGKSPVR